MATIGYVRVSSSDQSTHAQRHAIEARHSVDRWFVDEATSGSIKARQREGFKKLLGFAREDDTVIVYAIDRLGRDTVDVLDTVEALQDAGCCVISVREGFDLSTPIGKAMLTMLAAVAELERSNIKERQLSGIKRARAEGKHLGRPARIDTANVAAWRAKHQASIRDTAVHFDISTASVKRACRSAME